MNTSPSAGLAGPSGASGINNDCGGVTRGDEAHITAVLTAGKAATETSPQSPNDFGLLIACLVWCPVGALLWHLVLL